MGAAGPRIVATTVTASGASEIARGSPDEEASVWRRGGSGEDGDDDASARCGGAERLDADLESGERS